MTRKYLIPTVLLSLSILAAWVVVDASALSLNTASMVAYADDYGSYGSYSDNSYGSYGSYSDNSYGSSYYDSSNYCTSCNTSTYSTYDTYSYPSYSYDYGGYDYGYNSYYSPSYYQPPVYVPPTYIPTTYIPPAYVPPTYVPPTYVPPPSYTPPSYTPPSYIPPSYYPPSYYPPTYTTNSAPTPTCSLTTTSATINSGGSGVLQWSTSYAASAFIDQGIGYVSVPSGSASTGALPGTRVYTMTVYGQGNQTGVCRTTVNVGGGQVAGVFLSQVPYTGVGDSNGLTIVFWLSIVMLAALIAYFIVGKQSIYAMIAGLAGHAPRRAASPTKS